MALRKVGRPWATRPGWLQLLSADEVLVGDDDGVHVRAVQSGELLRSWPPLARIERPRVDRATSQALVEEPDQRRVYSRADVVAGRVEDEEPQPISIRDLEGRPKLSLASSSYHHAIGFADQGRRAIGHAHSKLVAWDTQSGARVCEASFSRVEHAAISPDQSLIAVWSVDTTGLTSSLQLYRATDLAPQWPSPTRWRTGAMDTVLDVRDVAFVDDEHVVVVSRSPRKASGEIELFDRAGHSVASASWRFPIQTVRVHSQRVLLGARARVLVLDGLTLSVLREEQQPGGTLELSPGGEVLLGLGKEKDAPIVAYDSRPWLDRSVAPTAAPVRKPRAPQPPTPRLSHWFFALPASTSEAALLDLGAAAHHMLDGPLRDFCMLLQPEETVRELRWFTFLARRRARPYLHDPWIDTFADRSPLVSVLHVELPRTSLRYAAAYVEGRRKPAMQAESTGLGGPVDVTGISSVAEGDGAVEAVLRCVAPGELPHPAYLSALEGPAYLCTSYAKPTPAPPALVAALKPMISFDEVLTAFRSAPEKRSLGAPR